MGSCQSARVTGEGEGEETEVLKAYLERGYHFTPFVCSVDGMLGQGPFTFAKCLAAKLASECKNLFRVVVYGYIKNAQMTIAIVRAMP